MDEIHKVAGKEIQAVKELVVGLFLSHRLVAQRYAAATLSLIIFKAKVRLNN